MPQFFPAADNQSFIAWQPPAKASQLAIAKDPSTALGLNMFGAMCGGLLEYNSMYFGFEFLYWLAIVLYAAALLSTQSSGRVLD